MGWEVTVSVSAAMLAWEVATLGAVSEVVEMAPKTRAAAT
jgi:hypothetical protein